MLASIIIPSYGSRLEYLKDTLDSVQNQNLSADEYEIIVVDNSPDGKILTVVEEANQGGRHSVRYARETQMGLLKARHRGAYEAKGQILVYIDDDIKAHPGWLKALMDPFADPDVGCSGGKIVPQWEAEVPSWFSQFKPGHLSILDYGDETKEINYPGFWGCNLAVRRDIFFAVGGSHPEIIDGKPSNIWWMGSGECGLEEKIYDLGFKLIYEPRAWLYHRIPASRLEPKYFYWRLSMEGVAHSYEHIRNMRMRNVKMLYIRIIAEIFLNAFRSVGAFVKSLVKKEQRIRLIAESLHWYHHGKHHLIVLVSNKMRRHVFQDSYL